MVRFLTLSVAFFCPALSAIADPEWDGLINEYEKARHVFMQEMAKGDGMIMVGPGTTMPEDTFRPRFRAYAEKHSGKPAALHALNWLLMHEMGFPGIQNKDSAAAWALEQLTRNHVSDPAIKDHLEGLPFAVMSVGEEKMIAFLEAIVRENKDDRARGLARLAKAEILVEGSPFPSFMGDGADRTEQKKQAERIFRELAKEFPKTDIAEKAEGYIFTIENLQVGMKAPDIVGKDIDGKEIKLSQFHGKVVLILFWGTWCVPCIQMIPHENELYEKLKDKRFTILGINSADEKPILKGTIEKQKITWPNIHDGMPDPGSICATWHVRSFPTVFLVDHRGVIRHKNPMPFQVNGAVEALVSEALSDSTD